MKANELEIRINAKLSVDKSTAEGALKLAELYCNDNGVNIATKQNEDGTAKLYFSETNTNKVRIYSKVEDLEKEVMQLQSRLRHLLKSDYIRSFDEVDRNTGDYKKDIREADRAADALQILNESHSCNDCKNKGTLNFCPGIGQKVVYNCPSWRRNVTK